MSVLNRQQRQVIRADTMIDPLLIDRVADAYDCLMRDDIEGYKHQMLVAGIQQGPVNEQDRPTAIDKVKTICIRSIAQQKRWSYQRTARWIEDRLK